MQSGTQPDQVPVVEARGVARRFGGKLALDHVSLEVQRGRVFGLVGENGAGKTTFIKLLLGLLRPSAGEVRVFGLDPVRNEVQVLSRIGYLSEDRDLPGWMRLDELMLYTRAFYPAWDAAYAERLLKTFGLDPKAKVKNLSRGERAQAGLVAALAYRPELLLLDEPSSGLDPIVRRDILTAIIRTVSEEGRTVIFSSHLLDEVDRVADDVAMIHHGKLILCDALDAVKTAHRRMTVRLDRRTEVPGVLTWEGSGRDWTVICDERFDEVRAALLTFGAEILEDAAPSLEDIFVARAGGRRTAVQEE